MYLCYQIKLALQYFLNYCLTDGPKINPEPDKIVMLHSLVSLVCEVIAYPLPNIDWIFTDGFINQTFDKVSMKRVHKQKDHFYKVKLQISNVLGVIESQRHKVSFLIVLKL